MDKHKIQAACAQYVQGYSTMTGPSVPSQNPAMLRGQRHAGGQCSDFYEEGWEDAARGTRLALNERAPSYVGKIGGSVSLEPEAQQERYLLVQFRDAVSKVDGKHGVEVLMQAIGARTEQILGEFEIMQDEQRYLRRKALQADRENSEREAAKNTETTAAAVLAEQASLPPLPPIMSLAPADEKVR